MKKIFSCAMIVAMAFALVSCGGEKKAQPGVLAPEKTEVTGDLADYFTVVNKTYEIASCEKSFGGDPIIAIELQRTEASRPAFYGYEPVGTSGYGVYGNYGIGIKVKDASGKEIFVKEANEGGLNGVYSHEDLIKLWNLEPGATASVRWSAEELKNIQGEHKFEITSYLSR